MVFTVALTVGFGSSDRTGRGLWNCGIHDYGPNDGVSFPRDARPVALATLSGSCSHGRLLGSRPRLLLRKSSEDIRGRLDPADIWRDRVIIMTTWHYGIEAVHRRNAAKSQRLAKFFRVASKRQGRKSSGHCGFSHATRQIDTTGHRQLR